MEPDNNINLSDQQQASATPKPHHPWRYVSSTLLLIAVIAATVYVVRTHKRPGQMTLIESQAMDMTVMKAPPGRFPVALETVNPAVFETAVIYSGSVVPFNEQDITPRVEGLVRDLTVYPGDTVRKGQRLARLESPDVTQRAAAASVEAAAAGAQAQSADNEVLKMQQMIGAADANIDSAKSMSDYRAAELARMEKLFTAGAVSRSEVEQEQSMNLSAAADLRRMQSESRAARQDFEAARKQRHAMQSMAAAGASQARAQQSIAGYLTLESPADGIVTQRFLSPGALARPGAPVLRIAEIRRVRLQSNVSAGDAARMIVGNPVRATTPRRPGKKFNARISAIFPASDPTLRTVTVEAVIDNPDAAFLPGDFVSLTFVTDQQPAALIVPERAVVRFGNNGGPAVWTAVSRAAGGKTLYTCVMHPEVIRHKPGLCPKCKMELVPKQASGNETAHLVRVALGATDGDRVVITRGLRPGDRVVTDGFEDISEGVSLFPTTWGTDGPTEQPQPSKGDMPDTYMKDKNPKKDTPAMDPNMPGM